MRRRRQAPDSHPERVHGALASPHVPQAVGLTCPGPDCPGPPGAERPPRTVEPAPAVTVEDLLLSHASRSLPDAHTSCAARAVGCHAHQGQSGGRGREQFGAFLTGSAGRCGRLCPGPLQGPCVVQHRSRSLCWLHLSPRDRWGTPHSTPCSSMAVFLGPAFQGVLRGGCGAVGCSLSFPAGAWGFLTAWPRMSWGMGRGGCLGGQAVPSQTRGGGVCRGLGEGHLLALLPA